MRSVLRRLTTWLGLCAAVVGVTGCSNGAGRDDPAPTVSRQSADRHDVAVDRALSAMHRAALRRDRTAVGRAQRELEQLGRSDPRHAVKAVEHDPFERVIAEFVLKRAPLFAQQITTTEGDHRMFVGIDRAAFCLMTPEARRAAVDSVYATTDGRLRAAGVGDLEFVVVPLSQRAATADRALAVGRRRSAHLTHAGRTCR